jgi:hypothetical protein
MIRRIMTAILCGLLCSVALAAQDFSGYFKNYSIAFDMPQDVGNNELFWLVSNRLRLDYRHQFPQAGFEASWDLAPRFQHARLFETDIFGFETIPSIYRIADFDHQLYPDTQTESGNFGLFHNLDRLNLTWRTKLGDVSIGRQAISWGDAKVISPTDIIAPFAFNELDREEVFGVDAVRVRVPTGQLSELDFGYVFGRRAQFEQSAFFVRNRFRIGETDASLIFMGFRENLLLGIDLSRSLGQMGLTADAAYVESGFFNRSNQSRDYVRISVGLDRALTGSAYGFFEYHYNSAGKSDPAEYLQLRGETAYSSGNVYLLGRHYFSVGGDLQLTPLLDMQILMMWNLQDRSFYGYPTLEYNLTANSYFSVGAGVGLGKDPVYADRPPKIEFRSEFGAYPSLGFISWRYYF